jgi:hypothetical protein
LKDAIKDKKNDGETTVPAPAPAPAGKEEDNQPDKATMGIEQLQQALSARNLKSTGSKRELEQRLEEAFQKQAKDGAGKVQPACPAGTPVRSNRTNTPQSCKLQNCFIAPEGTKHYPAVYSGKAVYFCWCVQLIQFVTMCFFVVL